jgi:hypothetical protein
MKSLPTHLSSHWSIPFSGGKVQTKIMVASMNDSIGAEADTNFYLFWLFVDIKFNQSIVGL